MSRYFLVTLLILKLTEVKGFDNYPVGAKSAAMSNASVTNIDVWANHHNQAALANYNKFAFGVHFENKFFIKEYSYQAAVLSIPTKTGTIGATYTYFGYLKYNEKKIGLAFGKTFANCLSAGIQLDYLHTYISEEYGKMGTIAVEAGLLYNYKDKFYVGTHLFNPTRSKYKSYYDETIPTIFRFGLGYHFFEKILLNIETEKEIDTKAIFKAGLEYLLFDELYLRAGISSDPALYSFGLGYLYKRIKAGIAFMSHPQLGFTPHFSIAYEFN